MRFITISFEPLDGSKKLVKPAKGKFMACEKHKLNPVKGYSDCPGCEVEWLRDRAEKAEQLAKRLADDALVSLAGIVCTPVEGYLLAPQCLSSDIRNLRKRCETIETTARTFLHDLDAHEAWVKPSKIKMNSAMWMQVEAFRKLLAESV